MTMNAAGVQENNPNHRLVAASMMAGELNGMENLLGTRPTKAGVEDISR